MAAVMLRDPGDQHIPAQVRELLGRLNREPAWGIEEILDAVTDLAGHGGHGFALHHPDMRAALFISGRGIARQRDLGQIDMRQIAPTVALLGVKLPSATAAPLLARQ